MSSKINEKEISLNSSGAELTSRLALRPKEAAEALGISERTLRTWMRNEELPAFRVGSVLRIRVSDLEKWIDERTETHRDLDELLDEILHT